MQMPRRRRFLRLFVAFTAAAALPACTTPPRAPAAAPPRLIVFIAVDGLPMRQITEQRAQFGPDGLARFLNRGTWFANAHYSHSYTVTAAGHATMLTGAYPHRSGIIGNEWRDITSGAERYNTDDPGASYIGHTTKPLDGTSPRNLRAETVGDVLRRATPASKVIAISGKDRGAILTAGKAGTAYMYMSRSGLFASSTFYMPQHPAWVETFNAAKPADRYFGVEWKPLLPEAAYAGALSGPQPWYGDLPGVLPLTMGGSHQPKPSPAPDPNFYYALLRSPFIDELSLSFAKAAVEGEKLGADDAPDILSLSLSGHDYVNHAFSAESLISHDHLLRLDRQFQDFFAFLDRTVGADRYVVVLTADHGFTPAPEVSRARGLDAQRGRTVDIVARVNAALEQQFGVAKLVRFVSAAALVIDRGLVAQKGLSLETVTDAARKQLVAEPAIAAAYTRAELQSRSRAGAPFFDAMERSWHADLSGDVQYVLKPYWLMSSRAIGTSHGQPHGYDSHVPILVWGPAWLGAGQVTQRVDVADIAPTLAGILRVATPSSAEGKPLPLPMP